MNKLVTFGVAALSIAGVVGASSISASAFSGQANGTGLQAGSHKGSGQGSGYQASLESRAKIFGMSVDDLKKALETETMSQIAVTRGMSEETFQAKMTDAAKARWEARGLSSDEITARTTEREARQATNSADHEFGSGEGSHQGGYGRNR